MLAEIKVPSAGESVTEGLLAAWLRKDGDVVNLDDPLFDIETEKAAQTVKALAAGKLAIKVPAGTKVKIGQVVGTIDTSVAPAPKEKKLTRVDLKPEGKPASAAPTSAPAPAPAPAAKPMPAPAAAAEKHDGAEIGHDVLSPAARKLVREFDINLDEVQGTGPRGKITLDDLVHHVETRLGHAGHGYADAAAAADAGPRQSRKIMSPLRQSVARRLVQAKQVTAMLTTFNEVDMTNVMALRDKYKEAFEKKHGVKLGFMSFFVKAAVSALQAVSQVNAFIDGEEVVQNNFVDIAVAVSTERGLVVPVVRNADKLSFSGVEKAIGELAKRAKEKTLTMDDMAGGSFTISNGGIFGSLLSTPILNYPQSAILGMHAIKNRPMAVGDKIEIRPMMYLAMSYDHRIIDGAEAVTFLKRIVECVEAPERLLLEV